MPSLWPDVYQCRSGQISALYANAYTNRGTEKTVCRFCRNQLADAIGWYGRNRRWFTVYRAKNKGIGSYCHTSCFGGIVIHNFTKFPTTDGMIIVTVLALINLWILYDNRGKYKTLIS